MNATMMNITLMTMEMAAIGTLKTQIHAEIMTQKEKYGLQNLHAALAEEAATRNQMLLG
jgi:hypothetical protein